MWEGHAVGGVEGLVVDLVGTEAELPTDKGDALQVANLEKKPLEKEKPSENFQCSSLLHHGEGPGVSEVITPPLITTNAENRIQGNGLDAIGQAEVLA